MNNPDPSNQQPSSKQSSNKQSLKKRRANYANQQARLVLLAGLPGALLSFIALILADTNAYLIAFLMIILALIISFAAISGRQKADYQIQTLSNLIEAMIDGDYSLRGRKQSNPAFQHLLTLINQLATTLQQHKLKAEQSQQLFNMVIQQMDALVIAVDEHNNIVILNDAAKKLLNASQPFDLNQQSNLNQQSSLTLGDLSLETLTQNNDDTVYINHSTMSGEYIIFRDRFINDNKLHSLFLLTRAEGLLRRKEREDWKNLIRVLSHELNNSLTPITSYASTMLRKIEREHSINDIERFTEGLSVIKSRAESLGAFIASYSQLAQLPPAKLTHIVWYDVLRKLTLLFPETHFKFNLESDMKTTLLNVDPKQFEQLMINLFKNAEEAMANLDRPIIDINAFHNANNISIEIKDNGKGVSNTDNIFVPFYSTKPSGSGIGLALCRQIMLAHSGSIRLINRTDTQGAVAILNFPTSHS